jgi:Ca2+-binding EF-hand superfamily protein
MSDADRDARVREDFNKIDTDNDGYITVSELREYHQTDPKATDEEVNIIAKYADSDGDKQISYEEYKEFVR